MLKQVLRFAFTILDGPNADLTSGSWRLWVHGEDTYLTPKGLGNIWKVSLHADVAWRIAVTREHMESERPVWPKSEDRAPWKFDPTPFVNGCRKAFAIATTRSSLLPQAPSPHDIHITVEDRWDRITVAYVWMTEPDVELLASRIIGQPLTLASGRKVWLSAESEAMPGGEEEPQAVSAMLEPMLPESHGVPVPGYLVRGVHLG